MNGEVLVRLIGVSRAYREGERNRLVLDGVQAQFARGESVAILGQSGSGKSTLLNLIGGIDRPDAGRIEVAGCDLVTMSEGDRTRLRRARIGFVYQFFNLIPTLTVLENLCLPLALNGRAGTKRTASMAVRPGERPVKLDQGRSRSRAGVPVRAGVWPRMAARLFDYSVSYEQQALTMLAEVGLAERGDSFPDVLSGGEQQRVAVARALVHEPELILADEPTGNLDAHNGRLVFELLTRLVHISGGTLILVTHSEALSARADRVLRMEDGRLHQACNATRAEVEHSQR